MRLGRADPDRAGADAAGHHAPRPGAGHQRSSPTSRPARRRPSPSTARSRSPGRSFPTATGPSSRGARRRSASRSSRSGSPSPSASSSPTWSSPRSSTRSRTPSTVLLALPFSVSGALFALWIGGQSLNVYSMLGVILLVGIAKKNSIMLVDFTNQVRERGVAHREALLRGVPDPPPADPDDVDRHHRRRPPARPRHRPGRRGPAADGDGARRRHGRLDAAHALRRAGRLQRPRRRPDVESAPQEDGERPGGSTRARSRRLDPPPGPEGELR